MARGASGVRPRRLAQGAVLRPSILWRLDALEELHKHLDKLHLTALIPEEQFRVCQAFLEDYEKAARFDGRIT